jgi:hypothetical protein
MCNAGRFGNQFKPEDEEDYEALQVREGGREGRG